MCVYHRNYRDSRLWVIEVIELQIKAHIFTFQLNTHENQPTAHRSLLLVDFTAPTSIHSDIERHILGVLYVPGGNLVYS